MLAAVYHLSEPPPTMTYLLDRLIYDLRNIGVDKLIVIDETDCHSVDYYMNGDSLIEFETFSSLAEVEAAYSSETFVYLENPDVLTDEEYSFTELAVYEHPTDCVYVVGPNYGAAPVMLPGRSDKTWVGIASVNSMYSESVLAVLMFDRKSKES